MTMSEGLIAALWKEAGASVPDTIPRLTYAEAMERFGSDRPDTRYGLEIFDASDVFRGADFGITRTALEQGGRVRGIRIPGGARAVAQASGRNRSGGEEGGRARAAAAQGDERRARRSGREVPRRRARPHG